MSKAKGFLSILIPSATVFISSACIMVLELVASRLIAKHLGSSLYTWTAVIGVVLTGITIGNYSGGRIADKFKPQKALSIIFILSALACVVVVVLNNIVGGWFWLWKLSLPMRVFSHVSIVFALPSVLLGMISPVVAKTALDRGLATGRTVGDIYAWGAAGSIAGTFAAGFFLIPAMGTIAIVWTVGLILGLMGLLYGLRFVVVYVGVFFFLCCLLMGIMPFDWTRQTGENLALRSPEDPRILYEDETPYCYVAVKQMSQNPDRREFIQDKLRHSEIIIDDVNNLQYFYSKIFASIAHGLRSDGDKINAMVIGGGGYAFPQYLEKNFPQSKIDVVEIDPGVTKAAYEAFGLSKDTQINTFWMDARNYVDELLEKKRSGQEIPVYDFIFEDAINDYSVPFQLVTKEFNEKIVQILANDGAYLVNLIDTYENGQFLGAMVNTLKETFEYVYVISSYMSLPSLRDTYVVIASQNQIDAKEIFARHNSALKLRYLDESDLQYLYDRSEGIILTDDYAPVENLLAAVVLQGGKSALAERYLIQADKLKREKKYAQSIKKYIKAAQGNPSMTIKAYNEIGFIYASQGYLGKAAKAFEIAIDYHYDTGEKQYVIGSLHYNLATVLQQSKQPEHAKQQYAKAIEQFKIEVAEKPESDKLWTKLGETYAAIGDFKSASDAFAKALRLTPGNMLYYENLAKSLEFQGRFDEAMDTVKNQILFMKRRGQKKAAVQLESYLNSLEYQKSKQK